MVVESEVYYSEYSSNKDHQYAHAVDVISNHDKDYLQHNCKVHIWIVINNRVL